MEVCVARQPVFDRQKSVVGYELLFRSGRLANRFTECGDGSATDHVVSTSLLTIGLETVVDGKLAFVNFDRSNLMGNLHTLFLPQHLVIEILETVAPDPDLLAACRELKRAGYTLALDDFVDGPQFAPLVQLAGLIKVDVLTTEPKEQERLLRLYQPRGVKFLAEKVETLQAFEASSRRGYDLFQGYFFARPVILQGNRIPPAKLVCLRLLQELQKPELSFKELSVLIGQDVSLSYTLLRYLNSARFRFRAEIDSISTALHLLGENEVRRWILLAAMPVMASDNPTELTGLALVRACFCQHLAELTHRVDPQQAFLMGLFSMVDAFLNMPLEHALSQAKIPAAICAALLGTAPDGDPLLGLYRLGGYYESGDWEAFQLAADRMGLAETDVAAAYGTSLQWAQQLISGPAASDLSSPEEPLDTRPGNALLTV